MSTLLRSAQKSHKKILSLTSNKWTNLLFDIRCRNKSSFHKFRAAMDVPEGLFHGRIDRFNGVTIESKVEYNANDDFAEKLKKSLKYWQTIKRRGIWFNILTEHADWIPQLAKNEFDFHHAKNGFVVMCRWLPTNEISNFPVFAHTLLGVGGLVVNDSNEILVVSERNALIPNSWKLPGGYVEQRENLIDAVIREVREETGIECEFDTVVSMRHSHGGSFDCSDFYVVIGLKPKTLDLEMCTREIAKLKWMPVDEYLQHPNVHETNRHFVRTYLDYVKNDVRFVCKTGKHQILKKDYSLYFVEQPMSSDKE